ncbi:MAG: right-handed parallel beta-helix repeat-containing protein, partial [bacterium]
MSDLLQPDRTHVQVALGVRELGWAWGLEGTDASPAPYFDNVALAAYTVVGPSLAAREIDLAQDSYPEIGTIDYGNLAANHVRFDMAQSIAPPGHLHNDAGDSMVVTAVAVRTGSVLNDLPKLHYRLAANPLFDPVRSSGLPNAGWVYGDSCRGSGGGVLPDRFCFDLPDTGFFFPGDVLHYYIEVQDNQGGDIRTTILPADTTGFGRFAGNPPYDETFKVRALPTLHSANPGDHPPILFINDNANRGGDNEWGFALWNLGYAEGTDYDQYWVNDPTAGAGNGIGGRATCLHLEGYATILYTCGDLSSFTISNGDPLLDPSEDVLVLDSWLQQGWDPLINRNLLLTGDNLVYDLLRSGGVSNNFVSNWLGVTNVSQDVNLLIGQTSPTVQAVPGNPVFTSGDEWGVYGGCPASNRFDAVEAPVGYTTRLAEFLDPDGNPGVYIYSAASLHEVPEVGARIISLPYDFMFMDSRRTAMLQKILDYFSQPGLSPPYRIPDLNLSAATTATPSNVSVFTRPSGYGQPLSACYAFGGAVTDATITLTLRDWADQPIPHYPAADLWLESALGGLVLCPRGTMADHDTDAGGVTTFSGPVSGGAQSDYAGGEGVVVMVGGQPLAQPSLPIYFNCADIDGDLDVDLADAYLLFEDMNGPYAYRSDFFWDGQIDLADQILFDFSQGLDCESEDGSAMQHIPQGTLPEATLGVYFDQAGTQRSLFIGLFQPFNAYVVLFADSVTTVAGAAWKTSLPPEILLMGYSVGGTALGDPLGGIQHGLAQCEVLPAGAPLLIATMQLILTSYVEAEIPLLAHDQYSDPIFMDCSLQLGPATGISGGVNTVVPEGTIVIDPDPDTLAAPWTLVGDLGYTSSGHGDAILTVMTPDTYTLTWGPVTCWTEPEPNPVSLTLLAGDTISFAGIYTTEHLPRTWHVPAEAPSIQAANDSCCTGDSVVVACGTYQEHDIVLKSGIVLRSETGLAGCVTIDAQSLGRVLYGADLDSTTVIEGLTPTGGLADDAVTPPGRGGGLYCVRSALQIRGCVFTANHADSVGGGASCETTSCPTFTDCIFTENWSESGGGGLFLIRVDSATVTDCLFRDNTNGWGGGGLGCQWSTSPPLLTRCTFVGNSAVVVGGGIDCVETGLLLDGCTLAGNSAGNDGGGLSSRNSSQITADNCIIAFSTHRQAVHCDTGSATFTCCDIYGNEGGDWIGCIAGQYGTDGNIAANPRFCDLTVGDLTLRSDSPCAPANNPCAELIGAWAVGCSFDVLFEQLSFHWDGYEEIPYSPIGRFT